MTLLFIGVFIGIILGAIAQLIGISLLRKYQRDHNIFNYNDVVRIIRDNPSIVKYAQDKENPID
jgi:hypothetical protein